MTFITISLLKVLLLSLLLLLLLLLFESFLLLSLFLLLLSEVLSPKGQPINESSQAVRYFNPDSQAALRRPLSDSAHVQRKTVEQFHQHEDNIKKHQ